MVHIIIYRESKIFTKVLGQNHRIEDLQRRLVYHKIIYELFIFLFVVIVKFR